MVKGCDCSHCPGCGDVEEPKKKGGAGVAEPESTEEEIEEIDLGDDDFGDDEEDELE